jgi:transposase
MRYELADYDWSVINRIKQCRRVATRYDANYLAFVRLASFRLWLRANESTS